MKKGLRLICLLSMAALIQPIHSDEKTLPTVELLGNEYFYYEVKKDESVYGIAKRYGWDLEELVRLNPNVGANPEKGTKLYYPTGKRTVVTELQIDEASEEMEIEPVSHLVKKGENIYSLSRQYNVPLEELYRANPEAKHGIKAGQYIIIPQSKESVSDKYMFYTVKPGDSLAAVAKKYNTTVEDLLKANSGLSEKNFRAGENIRIDVNSGSRKIVTELVAEERLTAVDSYKVKKDDTWKSISQSTGVDEQMLKEINEEIPSPEKNDIITIPIIETVEVEKETTVAEPPELTQEDIKLIYDSIHGVKDELVAVRAAIILDDPLSNKDMDFTKGFMVKLKEMGVSDYPINLNVIDGRVATNTLLSELENLEPNLIIATSDKNFPLFLADYGETNNVVVVNVFDVRNDLYEDNPSIIQILPPTPVFNELVAERLIRDFRERNLILLGDTDENDGVVEFLKNEFPEQRRVQMSLSEFTEFLPEDGRDYLVYVASGNQREEVADILQTLENISQSETMSVIDVVGRPGWVMMSDDFGDRFSLFNVTIPSRVWLDTSSAQWKEFESLYSSSFGGSPVNSLPNYAATGYDVASYFIPMTAKNGGDFNYMPLSDQYAPLQSEINLKRVNNWGGFINSSCYLLEFKENGDVRRITLK